MTSSQIFKFSIIIISVGAKTLAKNDKNKKTGL